MIAWISSPNPGDSTTRVVYARQAISTSLCPAPTVSIRMKSNPAASSTCTTPAVALARPPSSPREAIERINTPGSPASSRMRTRSPNIAPPVKGLEGSTATIATVCFCATRMFFARQLTKDDLPVPGAPVMPTRCALPARANNRSNACSPAGVWFSTSVNKRASSRRLPRVTASRSTISLPATQTAEKASRIS